MSGRDLIKEIKAGSESVWKHLFSKPAKSMRTQLGPIMKDVRDVTFDDVFEEACIILLENIKAGKLDEGEVNLEGYLYVLCKRIALRYARKKKAISLDSGEVTLKDEGVETSAATPEEEEEDNAKVDAFFDRVLEAMPSNQRAVLKYFYWDKMSMSEIASLCGFKNENVAKSTKKRYMENFKKIARQMLEDDEITEEAIAKTIERAAIRAQMDECHHLKSGVLAASCCKDGNEMYSDEEILDGLKANSSTAWKALYARHFSSLKKEISSLLD